jgi:hypothetical protein
MSRLPSSSRAGIMFMSLRPCTDGQKQLTLGSRGGPHSSDIGEFTPTPLRLDA